MSGVARALWAAVVMVCAVTGACGSAAVAETLFSDDFQDGDSDGWRALGQGDVRLTTYGGNVSLRLSRRAEALVAISAEGYEAVTVSLPLSLPSSYMKIRLNLLLPRESSSRMKVRLPTLIKTPSSAR